MGGGTRHGSPAPAFTTGGKDWVTAGLRCVCVALFPNLFLNLFLNCFCMCIVSEFVVEFELFLQCVDLSLFLHCF